MKINFVRVAAVSVLFVLMFQPLVFPQNIKNKDPEEIKYGDKPIYIQSSLGPFGEVYLPPSVIANAANYSLSGKDKISFEADNYFFPSIYFTISAKPNIDIKSRRDRDEKKDDEKKRNPDYEFTKKGENLNWMRVNTELTAQPCQCDEDDGCLKSNEIKIIGLSPEETKTAVKENPLAQIGTVGDALVNKLLPFTYAEEHPETQNASAEYGAISGAVSILFQNLFPAKAIAKNYSFIDGEIVNGTNSAGKETTSNRFGWFWQRKDKKETPESIIGVRRGTVFLQVARGVQSIKVVHTVFAKWDNDYSKKIDDEYVDVIANEINYKESGKRKEIEFKFDESNCFPPSKQKSLYERTDFLMLNHLDDFPTLIPKEVACKIFQQDTGDPKFRPVDIIDSDKLFNHYTNSADGSISKTIWDLIKNKVLKRLEVEMPRRAGLKTLVNVVNTRNSAGGKNPSDKEKKEQLKMLSYKAKIVLSDEMNRLYDDDEFYEFMRPKVGKDDSGNSILDGYKSQGETKKIQIAIRQKIESEIDASKLKQYNLPSQCENWFNANPLGLSLINGFNGNVFVKREEVKNKLDLPTLKDLLKKTEVQIVQKP